MVSRYQSINPQKALIWRIVHRNNLPWILDNGLHCSNSEVQASDWMNIGSPELIGKRASHRVPRQPKVVLLMMTFTQGNLLEARTEALVNTVNTVGVMGKGIALMFKERFADNFQRYAAACKAKDVRTGKMFITAVNELDGPRWIVNFPTKQHWRNASQMEWIPVLREGLRRWPGGADAAARKDRLFDDRALGIALQRLAPGVAVAV